MNFKRFHPSIQASINNVADALKQRQSRWPDQIILGSGEPDLKTIDYFPYVFLEAFPALTPTNLESFSLAGLMIAHASFLYDKVMDRTSSTYLGTVSALRLQAMQMESSHLLYQIFPATSIFWTYFHRYFVEYTDACLQEQRFATGDRPWSDYTEAEALQIALQKNGLARITIAGLAELSGDYSRFDCLVNALNQYNTANQLLDDLRDWKEDLQNGLPSLPLFRILDEWPIPTDSMDLSHQREALGRELYYGGHARYILKLALDSLDRSDQLAASIPEMAWDGMTDPLRQQCQSLLQDLDQIIQRNIHRNIQRNPQQSEFMLDLPAAQNRWQQLSWDSLSFLINQWKQDFGELNHIVYWPRREGSSASQDYHSSDIFQRSLIADALCDAHELLADQLQGQLQSLLDFEARYLIRHKLTSGVGGWSYFPTVPELAPDADDLGQIIQVLLRSGHLAAVHEHCEGPLSVLLADNARVDGSLETWIVPAKGRTPVQERQSKLNHSAWGIGPDNEVMANILYALELYDSERFTETIRRGIVYLESQQDEQGSWVSKWYYGPFYGTYVCLRLLAVTQPESSCIQSALTFLRTQQHEDGGWGMTHESDPLSTALALLGLASVPDGQDTLSSADQVRAERALGYLEHCQESDRGWPSVDFICPKINAPYRSRSITSMYILKATVMWHHRLHPTRTAIGRDPMATKTIRLGENQPFASTVC